MSSVNHALIDTALVTALRAEFPNLLIGDGEKPTGGEEQEGYAIVIPIPSGDRDEGSIPGGTRGSISWQRYQLVSCGVQRSQVRSMASDLAVACVARQPITRDWSMAIADPAGHHIMDRYRRGSIPLDHLGTWQAGELIDLYITLA